MSNGLLGNLIVWLLIALLFIGCIAYLLNWLYFRSTKETAFVRTGFGGETVVINGGALVLPIVHEVMLVNLNVVRIPVSRIENAALMTSDRMRVDVEAEFFVRVAQNPEAVATAASTLGRKTLDASLLADLLNGKFVGALRSAAARMTLDDMHERRLELVTMVAELASDALARNGLELESVAITDLDQTDLEFFNPANRFDAEGLTTLIETIEARRKVRNDIEQSSMLAIRERNLQAEQASLQLEQQSENARIQQQRALEAMRAEQRADLSRTRAEADTDSEKSRIESEQRTREFEISRRQAVEEIDISSRQAIEQKRLGQEQAIAEARIAQEQAIEQARINREREIRREQIKQQHDIDNAEVVAHEDLERTRIVSKQLLHEARITADREMESRDIEHGQLIDVARLSATQAVESARIEQDRILEQHRLERERLLREQQIEQREAIEQHEISTQQVLEHRRIESALGLESARIAQDQQLKQLEIERERTLELVSIERQILLYKKQSEQYTEQVHTEDARAVAVKAQEQVATARETEIAERVAAIDVLMARKNADTAELAAAAEKISSSVAAEARRLRNEAENVLGEDARAGALRELMINRLEGIVRESVRPIENIEGIKILHVDGLGGSGGSGVARSPTDEVIESALRYRAQAPLIDEMLKEIGVSNPQVSRMGDIFRSAKDAKSLASSTASERTDRSGSSDDD